MATGPGVASSFPAGVGGAVALRAALAAFGANEVLMRRPELVTPLTEHTPLRESFFFMSLGQSAYATNLFHQPPLLLALFYPLEWVPENVRLLLLNALFIAADVAVALLLRALCRTHIQSQAALHTD